MNYEIDLITLSKIFNVKERTISNWVAAGMPKAERGKYDLASCTSWLIKKLRKKVELLKAGDKTIYRLKKEGLERANILKDIDIKVKLRQLIDLDMVRQAWLDETVLFKRHFLSIIPKITIALQDRVTIPQDELKELVKKFVHEALSSLSKEININSSSFEDDSDFLPESDHLES